MSHSGNKVVKKKNTVNPDVGIDDIFGIEVAYLIRRKKPVPGDILQCMVRHRVRPRNPKLSLQWHQSFSSDSSTAPSAAGKRKDSWKRWHALERDHLRKCFFLCF